MSEILDRAADIAALGLTIESRFVPFSMSRNRHEPRRTLNWRVTVKHNGRAILTTDYSAGEAHCPSYSQGARRTLHYMAAIEHETETGRTARRIHPESMSVKSGKPIEPDALDVLYSLVADSSVLDSATYEDWAAGFGFDPDSRAGEAIYRQCLRIALKMRAALGDEGLARLSDIFQDY